jgi:hypothetical protein
VEVGTLHTGGRCEVIVLFLFLAVCFLCRRGVQVLLKIRPSSLLVLCGRMFCVSVSQTFLKCGPLLSVTMFYGPLLSVGMFYGPLLSVRMFY